MPTTSLEEPDLVRRRVKEHHLAAYSMRLDAGFHERTILGVQLRMQRFDVVHDDEHNTAGSPIAGMRREL